MGLGTTGSLGPLSNDKGKETQHCVSHGNKMQESQNGDDKDKVGVHRYVVVDPVGRSGGLALLWKEVDMLEIQNFS